MKSTKSTILSLTLLLVGAVSLGAQERRAAAICSGEVTGYLEQWCAEQGARGARTPAAPEAAMARAPQAAAASLVEALRRESQERHDARLASMREAHLAMTIAATPDMERIAAIERTRESDRAALRQLVERGERVRLSDFLRERHLARLRAGSAPR